MHSQNFFFWLAFCHIESSTLWLDFFTDFLTPNFFSPKLACKFALTHTHNMSFSAAHSTAAGLSELQNDPDIQAEALQDNHSDDHNPESYTTPTTSDIQLLALNARNGTHKSNEHTINLALSAGGLTGLRSFTNNFYTKAFQDSQLDPLIRSHDDPHGERFASWIAEKFGLGTPWSTERRRRPRCPFHANGHQFDSAHDRSSAHFAAWHSPKRSTDKWGDHFKLDDSRVWMRLHFWAARSVGMFETSPQFMNYYVRFIAHFVSVYERSAPSFARESARWSENEANIERYIEQGRQMLDVIGLTPEEANDQLPEEEREYTGSSSSRLVWPYGDSFL